jgi:hypothetical protein
MRRVHVYTRPPRAAPGADRPVSAAGVAPSRSPVHAALRSLHDSVAREHGADLFVVTLLDRIVDAIDTLGFLVAD